MSKSLIVYFSQNGTTARVAESIAKGLRTAEYQVDLCNMNDEQPPEIGGYDLLGIGLPVYYFRPPFNVADYLNSLPDLDGVAVFVFVLHGSYRGDASNVVRSILTDKGAQEVGYFHARGDDYFFGYLKQGYLFSPDHPTVEELTEAESFGQEVAARLAGREYIRAEYDEPPKAIYRLERFLSNRWMVRQIYSRLFKVKTKECTACGLCMKLCPTGNITESKEGYPVWGRDCLLCLTCEMKCPTDAVISPASWLLFRPFMIYNIYHSSRDPSLDYVRIEHSQGRTRRL